MSKLFIIEVNASLTLFFAVVFAFLGKWINFKVSIFRKYCIPSAVVGGLVACITVLVLRQAGIVGFTFDTGFQDLFMDLFFTASGFAASILIMKKSGKMILIFTVLASILAFLQNVLSVGLGTKLGLDPMIALMTGSIPLTGGHGYSAAFAPANYPGALSVAIAAATFGLVTGSLMGGPLSDLLIRKHNLMAGIDMKKVEIEKAEIAETKVELSEMSRGFYLIFIALGVGMILKAVLETFFPGVDFTSHVMGMVGGALTRVFMDIKKMSVPEKEIDTIGDIFLTVFVSMAVYTMRLWELAAVAGPMVVVLLCQLVLMFLFVRFILFYCLGRTFDSAVMCAGEVGFGLGAMPVAMANMNALSAKYYYSKVAFVVTPVVGGLFCNFTNAAIITMWLNWCA